MSSGYKLDEVLSMLDQVLMRLDRIEKLVAFDEEAEPEDVNQAFDRVFQKKVDKPRLSIVKSDSNNIVDFDKHD
jgi:predicted DNA-binding transcriptional regulator YafY